MQTNIIKTGFLAMIALSLNFNASAKIWRLNNNGNNPIPVIVADFTTSTTLQQAHDNASVVSGDTIHVEQSSTTYGPCVFSKSLIIIGAGYFLNLNPNTQVNTGFGSTLGALTFNNNGAAGTQVWGCTLTANAILGVSNLLIGRCNAVTFTIGNSANVATIDNIAIRQCYITTTANYTISNSAGTGTVTNVAIENNYIGLLSNNNNGCLLDGRVSGLFKNNYVVAAGFPLNIYNFYVVNNITLCTSGIYINTFNNCNVEYNIGSLASHFVTGVGGAGNTFGSGNLTQTTAQLAFVGGTSTDGKYKLGSGSSATGAGKLGSDCGMFGGGYPYVLSGIAPIPNIYSLTIAPIASGASSISVTVTAKGNNF